MDLHLLVHLAAGGRRKVYSRKEKLDYLTNALATRCFYSLLANNYGKKTRFKL